MKSNGWHSWHAVQQVCKRLHVDLHGHGAVGICTSGVTHMGLNSREPSRCRTGRRSALSDGVHFRFRLRIRWVMRWEGDTIAVLTAPGWHVTGGWGTLHRGPRQCTMVLHLHGFLVVWAIVPHTPSSLHPPAVSRKSVSWSQCLVRIVSDSLHSNFSSPHTRTHIYHTPHPHKHKNTWTRMTFQQGSGKFYFSFLPWHKMKSSRLAWQRSPDTEHRTHHKQDCN